MVCGKGVRNHCKSWEKTIWIFIFLSSPLPSITHTFSHPVLPPGPFSHHHTHKADWLDLARETLLATVATVGPAHHSSLLTVDTDPLLVVGMAASIQHPLGKISRKPGLHSTKHPQRLPAFSQQQRTGGPVATQHSSK